MSNKLETNDVRIYLKSFGYELISKEYTGNKGILIVKDNKGYYYTIVWNSFRDGVRPKFVHSSNPYSIQNIKLFLKNYKNKYTLISDEYKNEDSYLILRDVDGYYYNLTWRILHKNIDSNHAFVSEKNIYSTQNIKLFLESNNLNLILLNKFKNNKDKLILLDKNGYTYVRTWSDLKRLSNFHIADDSNPYSIQNIKLWCKLNNKLFELISTEYKNNRKKLQWKCLKEECGEEFYQAWDNISSGCGCSFCASKQVGLSNCLATKFPEIASDWHSTKNGKLTAFDITYGSEKDIWWQCKECNHEWIAKPNNRTGSNTGCPECNKSKGEKECKRVFIYKKFIEIAQDDYDKLLDIDKHNNTYFIPQKTFEGLIGLGGGLLSYDFYLPKYNLLVEYQGEYHDGTVKNQTKEDFERQVEHDRRKREYAKENKYNFLEIWYWDFDNIEAILTKELNILSKAS